MIPALHECEPARHLRIAVPAYTGHVTADTSHSLNEATILLRDAGIKVSFDYVCGSCYLDHARNMLATKFMESDATDLLFVDADLGFAPEAALKIAAAKRPFIAGLYCKKNDRIDFPVTFDADELYADADGYVEAATVPTGFLRLNRCVLDALPHEEYADNENRPWLGYFRCGSRNGLYWGEDTQLCLDWRALGGKIHIIPDLTFAHNGLKAWKANWHEWMMSRLQQKETA